MALWQIVINMPDPLRTELLHYAEYLETHVLLWCLSNDAPINYSDATGRIIGEVKFGSGLNIADSACGKVCAMTIRFS